MPKVAEEIWEINEISIPVDIYRDWRKAHRISIARNRVILRTAVWTADYKAVKLWALNWIEHQLAENPDLHLRFRPIPYHTGHKIHTPRRNYILDIEEQPRKTNKASLAGGQIRLVLAKDLDEPARSRTIQSLIARVLSRDQLAQVTDRIHELNERWIGGSLHRVRIKNNVSNWGSCSSNGNINISTRTLLAPLEIQDYIFIHELAHLREMNHSDRFWKIVAQADPNYISREKWLKTRGKSLTI